MLVSWRKWISAKLSSKRSAKQRSAQPLVKLPVKLSALFCDAPQTPEESSSVDCPELLAELSAQQSEPSADTKISAQSFAPNQSKASLSYAPPEYTLSSKRSEQSDFASHGFECTSKLEERICSIQLPHQDHQEKQFLPEHHKIVEADDLPKNQESKGEEVFFPVDATLNVELPKRDAFQGLRKEVDISHSNTLVDQHSEETEHCALPIASLGHSAQQTSKPPCSEISLCNESNASVSSADDRVLVPPSLLSPAGCDCLLFACHEECCVKPTEQAEKTLPPPLVSFRQEKQELASFVEVASVPRSTRRLKRFSVSLSKSYPYTGYIIPILHDTIDNKCSAIKYDITEGIFHVKKTGYFSLFLWQHVLRTDIPGRQAWCAKWALYRNNEVIALGNEVWSMGNRAVAGGIVARLDLQSGDELLLKCILEADCKSVQVCAKARGVILCH
jgi:hypothetical protein